MSGGFTRGRPKAEIPELVKKTTNAVLPLNSYTRHPFNALDIKKEHALSETVDNSN